MLKAIAVLAIKIYKKKKEKKKLCIMRSILETFYLDPRGKLNEKDQASRNRKGD